MALVRLMSPNCQHAQGRPAREHHCSGCAGCECHHVPAEPGKIRALFEARRRLPLEVRRPDAAAQTPPGAAGGEDPAPGGEA